MSSAMLTALNSSIVQALTQLTTFCSAAIEKIVKLQLLHAGQLQPQSLCIILHSIGRLSQQQQQQHLQQLLLLPPAALLQELVDYVQPLLPFLPPAGLNMLSNALMLLKADPNSSWQASFLQASQAAMRQCDARNAAVLAVPLLRWKAVPSSSWLQQYLKTCEPLLQQMQPKVRLQCLLQTAVVK
jgi:hypothetical protein